MGNPALGQTPGMLSSTTLSHIACSACILQTCTLGELPPQSKAAQLGSQTSGVMWHILECSV